MKNNQTICRYVIVRFLPYLGREEFVNVGVITAFPELGKIDFKLELNHTKRVTDFFPDFSRYQFKDLAKRFYHTFNEIRNNCITTPLFETDVTSFNSFFDHLVKPYDELFQFSKSRICLTDNPLQETEKIFARFVKQATIGSLPGHEEEMKTRIRNQLKSLHATDAFVARTIKLENGFRMQMPFAKSDATDHLLKAIQPIFLGYKSISRITDHGAGWLYKFKKAQKQKLLPERTLVIIGGKESSEENSNAINGIMSDLREIKSVDVIDKGDIELIEDFVS